MVLNWTPEAIVDVIAALILLICALVSFTYLRKKK